MSAASKKTTKIGPNDKKIILFRLYIADETLNSVRAIANLGFLCQEYLCDRCQVEIVDILQEPLRALIEGVLITPTLVKLSPSPKRKIVGDLGETETVLHGLGLMGAANEKTNIRH